MSNVPSNVERDENGRTPAQVAAGCPPGIQPGQVLNRRGYSDGRRVQDAVRRALKKKMRAGDVDELDQLGEEIVAAATAKDAGAVRMLLEIWSREDGPLETRLTGADGGPLVVFRPLVMVGIDPEAARTGLTAEQLKALPTNGNGQH